MSAKKIPIGNIPIPPPDLIPDEDDFDAVDEDVVEDTTDDEDEYPAEDDVDEDYLNDEDADQVDEQSQDEQRRHKDDTKKDKAEKPKKEEEEPGKQRSEDPTPEANRDPRTEPQTKTPGEGQIPGEGVGAGEEVAGQAARTATGAAGRGAAVASEGAATAAGGAAGAAGGAAAAGAAAAGAGAAAVGEGAAVAAVTVTAPAWLGPVLIGIVIIAVIIAGFMVYGVLTKNWQHLETGAPAGSRTTTPADITDANLRTQIAELAVAAGDNELRKTITREKLADVFNKLTAAATAAADEPSRDLLIEHITAARNAASIIVEPVTTAGDNFTRQLKAFQYHMSAIASALMGIGNDTAETLVARANEAFNFTWTWTGNSSQNPDAPFRDGTGTPRSCDAAGFITYVLRNPAITPTDGIVPSIIELPTVFSSALTPIDFSGGFTTDLLEQGDIILTKRATTTGNTTTTDYAAFIYLGETANQLAFCGSNGLGKLPVSALTEQGITVTSLLRLKTAP